MFDLHCHLLPGIDDGPKTLEESIELCEIAVADGITHSIVTPHIHPGRWENNRQRIEQLCDVLRQELHKHKIKLQLGFAGEVRLSDQIMRQVEAEEIPFYGEVGGYQIMLLEFPHSHVIPGTDKLVAWLLNRNIRPLIAHPERNKQIMKDPMQVRPLVDVGCWLQVTAGSVLGSFGEAARRAANLMLSEGLVTVLASDGHNAGARRPVLKQAFDRMTETCGVEEAMQLIVHRPAEIVGNQFCSQGNVE